MMSFFYLCFIFVLYSFLGWILEDVYYYVINGSFKKDGFLYSPFKPMYGFAMSILVFLKNIVHINGVVLLILFFIVPTIIEYISGEIMIKRFKKKYWDYSKNKLNFKGIICLKFSIYWGILTTFTLFVIQPIIDKLFFRKSTVFIIITVILCVYLTIDLIFTNKHLYYR